MLYTYYYSLQAHNTLHRLNNLPKVTILVHCKARIQTEVFQTYNHFCIPSVGYRGTYFQFNWQTFIFSLNTASKCLGNEKGKEYLKRILPRNEVRCVGKHAMHCVPTMCHVLWWLFWLHKHLILTTILEGKYWYLLFYIKGNWNLEDSRRFKITEIVRHKVRIRNQIQSIKKYLLNAY